MTNNHRKSDRSVVLKKRPNKASGSVAERVDGRDLTKGNSRDQNAPRTQRRTSVPCALERVRQVAKGEVIVVRFAEDGVLEFQEEVEAKQFQAGLTKRFRKFNLEMHPDKTRVTEFGLFAVTNWGGRGE